MKDFFTELQFTDDDILTFEGGIPGFDNFKKFAIVTVKEHLPFEWLVCVEDPHLRFAVVNPMLFMPDYNPKISKFQLEDLNVKDAEDLKILAIITIKQDIKESTANLVGPIFINIREKRGKQIIIDDDAYSTQEKIIK